MLHSVEERCKGPGKLSPTMRPIHLNLKKRQQELRDRGHKITYAKIAARMQAKGLSVGTSAVGIGSREGINQG